MKKHSARSAKRPSAKPKIAWTTVVLAAVVVLAGFGAYQFLMQAPANNVIDADDYDNMYKPPTEGSPSIMIISPMPGQSFASSTVGIRVNVTNFQIVDIVANRANVENQGHLLFVVDGREQRGVFKTTSFANLPDGEHTLRVELQNNDRTNLNPRVFATVTFFTT